MSHIKFKGRILFLSDDPDKIARQFAGTDFITDEARPLRDDISTDEITPIPSLVHYDQEIANHAHIGFETAGQQPISVGAISGGGFSVIVGGKRYGKGSSREHSPLAERRAGIHLIIAESFERLYRQNADNLGLFTCTDFGLIDRIRAGEEIPLSDLLAGREPLAQKILTAGGLLTFGSTTLTAHQPTCPDHELSETPKTLVQKIIERHAVDAGSIQWTQSAAGLQPGTAGFVKPAWRYFHDIYSAMCAHMLHETFGEPLTLYDPATIISFEDHYSYAHRPEVNAKVDRMPGIRRMSDGHREFVSRYGLLDYGYLPDSEGSAGISHAVMAEYHALPGQLIAGTDSHTPHNGAVGALAYGVGSTDMANAMMIGLTRITVPETIRVDIRGPMADGIMAKDIVLHLLADPYVREGGGIGKVFEFSGDAIGVLSIDERATLTNMTAELGGLSGIVAPDNETVRFLKERRGIDFTIEPWMASDPGCDYDHEMTIDCRVLKPMLARPGDPGNGVSINNLSENIKIGIAYGGSCTAGKRADFDAYHAVLKWAADRGLRVPAEVTFYLQFGTIQVRDYCLDQGYLEAFQKVGADILQPACGACAGCGPGLSTDANDVTISAINRNFPGRSGPGKVWLASPLTVAASAIAGEILSFDDLKSRHS